MTARRLLSPQLPTDYVALDLETTGFSPRYEDILEIGAVRVRNGRVAEEFSQLIRPNKQISPKVEQLTGITLDTVRDAPEIGDVIGDFVHWVGDDKLVGHNVRFDVAFLAMAAMRTALGPQFRQPSYDTMSIDKRLFPSERHRLADLIVRYGIADTEQHRALSDATQTYQCLEWQRRYIASKITNIAL
ncbi:DNA polymerase III subunit epsilon [Bifidobacterium dolichotidis]|uniref:DNA polymerase III subunit epsilon n=1 Tax=Bifidobacterium dolichotidis TaxID=2306976 RepID=A0A430FRX3_9BIFI|nr:3'-5' exonuclease [Bifidobacterium dolichotidis]RSX55631.1 DNA polymerase III subunit epsilon [Bifidobacterium dolichotidis]